MERDEPSFSLVVIDKETGHVYTFCVWETNAIACDWVAAHVFELQARLGHNNFEAAFRLGNG